VYCATYLYAEDMTVRGAVGDEVRDAFATVRGELLHQRFQFDFSKRTHCDSVIAVQLRGRQRAALEVEIILRRREKLP